MFGVGWKQLTVAVLVSLAGGALIAWGWWREGTAAYLSPFLLEIGAALLLVVPLAVIGYLLAGRISRAEARTDEIEERVTGVEEEVARTGTRLDDLDAQFAGRVASTRAEADQRAQSVRDEVSFTNVRELLENSENRRATSSHGTRVALDSGERARFQLVSFEELTGPESRTIQIHLEAPNGSRPGVSVYWKEGVAFEAAWEALAHNAQAKNCYPGDATFAPGSTIRELIETVERAIAARDDPRGGVDLEPIIEVMPDNWALADNGLYHLIQVTLTAYAIPADRLIEDDHLVDHMLDKNWVGESVRETIAIAKDYFLRRAESGRQAAKTRIPSFYQPW